MKPTRKNRKLKPQSDFLLDGMGVVSLDAMEVVSLDALNGGDGREGKIALKLHRHIEIELKDKITPLIFGEVTDLVGAAMQASMGGEARR